MTVIYLLKHVCTTETHYNISCRLNNFFQQKVCKNFKLQLNLGFRTSRSSNNSVFERKIRDENHSVLERKFGYQTTQEKDFPEPKRQRVEKTHLELSDVFMEGDFQSKK